jgi:glutaredoxin 3
MARIEIYTTQWCSFCARAKALLDAHGLMYEEISLDAHPDFRQRLVELSGRWTVPQIIVDGTPNRRVLRAPSIGAFGRSGCIEIPRWGVIPTGATTPSR